MKRTRTNQSAAVRFGPALKAVIICLFIGSSGVGYVWQQNQLLELGRQKAEKEKRLNRLRLQNSQLAWHLAELQSPKSLETRLKELNLGLRMAQPTQIVWLMDAPLTPAGKPTLSMHPAERQYAQRRAGASPAP